MKYSAIVLLGGTSSRFSNDGINKVYISLNGKPVFMHSVDAFLSDPDCDEIVIVYNIKDLEIIKTFINNDKIKLVAGGKERYQSVLNGAYKSNSTYVLVHDGARPNINLDIINKVKKKLEHSLCVSLGVPVSDTIKKVTEKVETINRDSLYYMQTPQGSNRQALIEVLEQVKPEDKITDDLMAFEKYSNIIPTVVIGDKNNIKITTNDDYEYLKFLMENKNV